MAMYEIKMGMLAKSLAGHDKGKMYVILSADEQFVYLLDGTIRKLENPKKKRLKHVQIDCTIPMWIQNLLNENKKIYDSDIIRALREYNK